MTEHHQATHGVGLCLRGQWNKRFPGRTPACQEERAERLIGAELIDKRQFHQFTIEGAIGSHLENVQLKGGFRGFNPKAVSVIIEAADPRRQAAMH